ncbi:hypothetical protein [Streptomyces coeruleorubidus]|uniref:hypothetical protein n=1 Tax=Streptomyces coeruleorubidus TaxID=116188 RepID=UPI003789033E
MKALVIDCTLKKSPETSNTEALASVVVEQLEKEGVAADVVRAVDLDIGPGMTSEPVHEGVAWTYWNQGPGPGPSFLDAERGHDWSRSTGRAMSANLLGVARALAQRLLGPPPQ